MQKLYALIRKVGDSDIPVLIQGESGTGKELVAAAIYQCTPVGEFVPIDCGAMSANLIESELFGHERGAFTGAAASRAGLLETAHGGTAFFDEIGELPVEVQPKLLRVLQQHEVRPVGANRARRCRFRVIAATNRVLAKEVENGRFRLDLYHRLNAVTLEIPPLRERPTDIPLLVEHFLRLTGRSYALGPALMDNLMAHTWPGNVRELQNCIARLVAFSSNGCLDVADLHFPIHTRVTPVSPPPLPPPTAPAGFTLHDVEDRAISLALASYGGNLAQTAKSLGISRTTLYRRRKQHKLGFRDSTQHCRGGRQEQVNTSHSVKPALTPARTAFRGTMHERGAFYALMPKPLPYSVIPTLVPAGRASISGSQTLSDVWMIPLSGVDHLFSLTI